MKRNGHIIEQPFEDSKGRTLRLTDGRIAILHNETRPVDGQVYLVGQGSEQSFRVFRVRTTTNGFNLVPEDSDPVGIEPGLLMLFRVVDSSEPENVC